MRTFTKHVFDNPAPARVGEDCLYLNVYTPSKPAPEGGWPVMFWIFGGNLQFGASQLVFYDGTSFAANQDVIIVTTNYRTNGMIFDFCIISREIQG